MTIFYPDVSHYDLDRGVQVEPGTAAVIAKATHGKLFVDRGFSVFRSQAELVGAIFAAYHWLNHGDGTGQARYCHSQVGATPVMVDAEDQPGNTGYAGPLAVQDIVDFVSTLRALGGVCNLVYLPRWYWAGPMGSPDLKPLRDLGLGLVSSNYTSYSDAGPGWQSYGGMTPVCWQYTDNLSYGGGTSDFNAFRGSIDEFRALLTAGGADVAFRDDPDAIWMLNRIQGMANMNAIQFGPEAGRVPPLVQAIQGLQAAAAGDEARDTATFAAVNALADLIKAGGGDVDVAAIRAAIDDAAGKQTTIVQALSAQVAELQQELAAYRRAEAEAAQAEADRLRAQ